MTLVQLPETFFGVPWDLTIIKLIDILYSEIGLKNHFLRIAIFFITQCSGIPYNERMAVSPCDTTRGSDRTLAQVHSAPFNRHTRHHTLALPGNRESQIQTANWNITNNSKFRRDQNNLSFLFNSNQPWCLCQIK